MTDLIVTLIPAHNEESQIVTTLTALKSQSRVPDRIVVVADNCTDKTVEIARSIDGVDVFETERNRHKKAGALNQALSMLLPDLTNDDVILVQDADSQLDPGFVAAGMKELNSRPRLGAVGGTFRASALPQAATRRAKMLLHLQDNEYARYARDVRRLNGRCLVLTGIAAMFRVKTLRALSSARLAGRLPSGDGQGGVYDRQVQTEDNELSFAIMHLGFEIDPGAGVDDAQYRDHDDVARPLATATALEAWRHRELRPIRPDESHVAVLGTPDLHHARDTRHRAVLGLVSLGRLERRSSH